MAHFPTSMNARVVPIPKFSVFIFEVMSAPTFLTRLCRKAKLCKVKFNLLYSQHWSLICFLWTKYAFLQQKYSLDFHFFVSVSKECEKHLGPSIASGTRYLANTVALEDLSPGDKLRFILFAWWEGGPSDISSSSESHQSLTWNLCRLLEVFLQTWSRSGT